MDYQPYDFNSMEQQRDSLNDYTVKTFLWMTLGLLVSFAAALICWMTNMVYMVQSLHLVLLIATLVLSFTMSSRIEHMSVGAAKGIFLAFSVLFGLTLSVYLLIYDLRSVIFSVLATALYFGILSIYGHLTHRDLSSVRPILTSGLIFLIIFSVMTWFIPWLNNFDKIICIIGIATFLGYTAYDTQQISSYYHYYYRHQDMLEKASIFSALQLYMDFINLFLYLLRYLGRVRDED